MKQKFSLALGFAALLFVGCVADVEVVAPPTPEPDGAITIKINGSIDQSYTTRVDDGGFCDGDQVGLYGVNYSDNNTTAGTLLDEGNQVDNARYTFDEASRSWSSSGNIYYKDAETNIDLYGYYPYGKPESASAFAFEVKQDQANNNGYGESDFLWGKVENVAPSEQRVRMTFYHRMASANVTLVEGSGFAEGEFDLLPKSVMVSNVTRTAEVNLATGEVVATGEPAAEGTLMMHSSDGTFRAIVVPQRLENKLVKNMQEKVNSIIEILKKRSPDALCALHYGKDYELMIAVRLSAQCTDARVNLVTPALFAAYPTLESLAEEPSHNPR